MTTDIATRPANDLAAFLGSKSSELAALCGKALTPQRVIQLTMLCAYKTPKLLDCERASVLACISQVASMNLDLNPTAGEAYLIPRRNKQAGVMECTLQIGYQGLCKCARSSGAVRTIHARLVREGDYFKVTEINGTPNVVFEQKMDGEAGNITHVYAAARLASGDPVVEVMTAEEVEYVRKTYADEDSQAWEKSWGEQAKKTVVRRMCKYLPKSDELVKAIEVHDSQFTIAPQIEAPKERVDNGSGYGRGTYADLEKVQKWLGRAKEFLDGRNQKWLDHWTGIHFKDGLPAKFPSEVCRLFQLDNHLVKWGVRVGHLKEGSVDETGLRDHQLGKLTALMFFGPKVTQKALIEEAHRYVSDQEHVLVQKIEKMFPELNESQESPDDDDAVDQAMDEIAAEESTK